MKTGPKAKGWSRGQLARLACDTAGNTMLMMAAAMIPIIGMAGSAFDMSRAYMVKSRLQQACDAGALAGRRAMTAANFSTDTNAQAQARAFFTSNYANGAFGTTNASFSPVGTNDGQVKATATATVPMTLMRMFDIPSIVMNVACEARLEIANNDIMFVLDVTGSMADSVNGEVKIVSLRSAVNAFYDELAKSTSTSARVRYGFVPFSSGINVGQLLLDAGKADYLADSHTYQSRIANYTTPEDHPTDGTPSAETVEIYSNGASISQNDCGRFGLDQDFGSFNGTADSNGQKVLSGGPPPAAETRRQYSNNKAGGADWGWSGAADTSGTYRSCRRRYVDFERTYERRFRFTNWTYEPVIYDTSQYKLGNSVALAENTGGSVTEPRGYNIQQLVTAATVPTLAGLALSTASYSWNRCIEERQTVAADVFDPLPADAFDLDINKIPDSDPDTRWKPIWRRVVTQASSGTNPSTQCPAPARRLATMSATEVSNYVDTLQPTGSTYLDFGMIWGARLISPTGIFGADNLTAPNGRQINRHVVFMTDGLMDPSSSLYTMYGYEVRDKRISGDAGLDEMSVLRPRHKKRFVAVCKQLKDMNITVWTIAFATSQEPEMVTCATAGHALTANDSTELRNRFKEIANRIAELRLSK